MTSIESAEDAAVVYCAIERLGHHRTVADLERKVGIEWNLVTMAYNLKRLHRMESVQKAETFAPARA